MSNNKPITRAEIHFCNVWVSDYIETAKAKPGYAEDNAVLDLFSMAHRGYFCDGEVPRLNNRELLCVRAYISSGTFVWQLSWTYPSWKEVTLDNVGTVDTCFNTGAYETTCRRLSADYIDELLGQDPSEWPENFGDLFYFLVDVKDAYEHPNVVYRTRTR
jgi:hypothetical protein